jgi:hypothetical protein
MTDFPTQILDYWHRMFETGTVIADSGTFSVTVNPAPSRKRQAMILEQLGGRARAALTPTLARNIGIDRMQYASATEFRQRLANGGAILHDPDMMFYFPISASMQANDALSAPRQLTNNDCAAFETFQAAASEQDLENAFVELDHWALFVRQMGGDRSGLARRNSTAPAAAATAAYQIG